MKYLQLYFLLLLVFPKCFFAQNSKSEMLVGLGVQHQFPPLHLVTNIPSYKLGLNSFSYTASLENRFTIHNKLKFSLQYLLNYTQPHQARLSSYVGKQSEELSTGLGFVALYQVHKSASLQSGLAISKPVPSVMDKKYIATEGNATKASQQFAMTRTFILGFENSMKIFNKKMIYSLQYNLGFMPKQNSLLESKSSKDTYNQAVQFGLKYKY